MDELVRLVQQCDQGHNSSTRGDARNWLRRFAQEDLNNLVAVVETLFSYLTGQRQVSNQTRNLFVEQAAEFLRQAPETVQANFLGEGLHPRVTESPILYELIFESLASAGLITEIRDRNQLRRYISAFRRLPVPVVVEGEFSVMLTIVEGRVYRIPNRLVPIHPIQSIVNPVSEARRDLFQWWSDVFWRSHLQSEPGIEEDPDEAGHRVMDRLREETHAWALEFMGNQRYRVSTVKCYRTNFLEEVSRGWNEDATRGLSLNVWLMPVAGDSYLERHFPPGVLVTGELAGIFGPAAHFSGTYNRVAEHSQVISPEMMFSWDYVYYRAYHDVVCTRGADDRIVTPRLPSGAGLVNNPFKEFRRFVPRQGQPRRETGSDGNRRPPRQHIVGVFVRSLPPGQIPSREALELAASFEPPIHLEPGETCVRSHNRGGRKNLSTKTLLVPR